MAILCAIIKHIFLQSIKLQNDEAVFLFSGRAVFVTIRILHQAPTVIRYLSIFLSTFRGDWFHILEAIFLVPGDTASEILFHCTMV